MVRQNIEVITDAFGEEKTEETTSTPNKDVVSTKNIDESPKINCNLEANEGEHLVAEGESLYGVDISGDVVLCLGSEGDGLRRLTKESCDRLISIPMRDGTGSLNVAVAARKPPVSRKEISITLLEIVSA